MNKIQIIDRSCDCHECVSRTDQFYFLSVRCMNCGERHIAKIRKGDRPGHFLACPACEVVGHLNYGTSAEVADWLAEPALDTPGESG